MICPSVFRMRMHVYRERKCELAQTMRRRIFYFSVSRETAEKHVIHVARCSANKWIQVQPTVMKPSASKPFMDAQQPQVLTHTANSKINENSSN